MVLDMFRATWSNTKYTFQYAHVVFVPFPTISFHLKIKLNATVDLSVADEKEKRSDDNISLMYRLFLLFTENISNFYQRVY